MRDKFRETEKITWRAGKIKVLQLRKESPAGRLTRQRETHNQDILNQSNNDGYE